MGPLPRQVAIRVETLLPRAVTCDDRLKGPRHVTNDGARNLGKIFARNDGFDLNILEKTGGFNPDTFVVLAQQKTALRARNLEQKGQEFLQQAIQIELGRECGDRLLDGNEVEAGSARSSGVATALVQR